MKSLPGGLVALALLGGGAAATEPVKVRAAWVVAPANWTAIILEKKELARHLGRSYTLEPVYYAGTPLMITAMATGELEIGTLAYSTLALAIENAGMDDLRVISDDFQDGVADHHTNEYFVLKDSAIKTVEDLKGKVLATNAAGSAVDIAMRAMLRRHGLEDKRDYTVVEAAFPTMRAILTEKKADLIPGVIPFAFDPELRQRARVLFTQKEAIGPTQMIVCAARKGFLDKHRAAMVDLMEDVLRIVRWYLDPANHKEAMNIAARFTKQPLERLDWLFTTRDYYRDRNMLPNLVALQANISTQKELGFLRSDIDIGKHADLTIVEEAAERLK
jgi:NitT/TauT family transport system substrate-binding protein